jgi:phosphate transport system protein
MRRHYVDELDATRQNLVEMGETTIALMGETIHALVENDPESTARASELESQTDHQHRMIHDQCLNLITLQSPVARDARMVTGILDAIVDLELIGDYAFEVVMLSGAMHTRPPSQVLSQFSELGGKILGLLSEAIDGWRGQADALSVSVRTREAAVRCDCQTMYDRLSRLVAGVGDGTSYLNLLLICKHLERILRHTVSVAEQAAGATGTAGSVGQPIS